MILYISLIYYFFTSDCYECYDTIEDQYFRAGDKWTTVRNLTDHTGVVAGISAYYSCTCEGGDTGRYLCRPTEEIY